MIIGYLASAVIAGMTVAIASLLSGMGVLVALLAYSGVGVLVFGMGIGLAASTSPAKDPVARKQTV